MSQDPRVAQLRAYFADLQSENAYLLKERQRLEREQFELTLKSPFPERLGLGLARRPPKRPGRPRKNSSSTELAKLFALFQLHAVLKYKGGKQGTGVRKALGETLKGMSDEEIRDLYVRLIGPRPVRRTASIRYLEEKIYKLITSRNQLKERAKKGRKIAN